MKSLYLFLGLVIAGLYACRDHHTKAPTADTPDYKKGESLLDQHPDSAFYYFNKVATSSKDSLLIAKSYNYMAVIQSDAGDYFGSVESLLTSLKYLHEKAENNQNCLVSDYNELGRNSAELNNYDAAITYYQQAIDRSQRTDFKAIALNNQAVAYEKMGRYTPAIAIYRSILDHRPASRQEYARVLSNLAKTRWLQDSGYDAAPELLTALRIRKEEGDDWGLNASYAHLSDYYTHTRPDSALFYAHQMFAIAQHLASPDDQLQALEKLIGLSPAKLAKTYFLRYESLNDSIQTARNAAKNQFALIRYEAQKTKADNLRLQQENTAQNIVIDSIVVLFIIAACAFTFWYRKRKQRLEWEAQSRIRDDRLKTSQRIHDVVANGLYRVMTGVEHQETILKDRLLDDLEVLYEQSRDISHEQARHVPTDFQGQLADLLKDFAGEATRISIVGNETALWHGVTDHVKKELKLILQELMTNMKKHSSAQNVLLKFDRRDNHLFVQYTDDGIGFSPARPPGNGLTNTGNRMNGIGGRITFDHSPKKGVKINLSIPIAPRA